MARFQPYDRVQEPQPDAREAAARFLLDQRAAGQRRPAFLFVNNRLERDAPATLEAILDALGATPQQPVTA